MDRTKNKGRYIQKGIIGAVIISVVSSIVLHLFLFGGVKARIATQKARIETDFYQISFEQFNYLDKTGVKGAGIVLSEIPQGAYNGRSLWRDNLDIIKIPEISRHKNGIEDEIDIVYSSRAYDFSESLMLQFSEYSQDEFLPSFGELFTVETREKSINQNIEEIFKTENDIRISYYLRGPVATRQIVSNNIQNIKIDVEKGILKARYRFWVSGEGRVNQVLIEEGSMFPLIDSRIVNMIKTWRFAPGNLTIGQKYEWGVLNIILQK